MNLDEQVQAKMYADIHREAHEENTLTLAKMMEVAGRFRPIKKYGKPSCGTCRGAVGLLCWRKGHRIQHSIVETYPAAQEETA